MDILLIILGFIFVILGVLGSFIPLLPGPLFCFIGLLLLYLTDSIPINYWSLSISALSCLILSILDYVIPARGTKKYGGSSYGVWGTNIGLLVGLLSPLPFGFILGPFLGAFLGEILYDHKNHNRALKAATGSFIGFIASSVVKFMVCMMHAGYFLWLCWNNRTVLL
ncbi:hypothetical protein SAMN05444143_1166 [Flavobacterium succinicans]|uniref:DUF456 domain-containing protein n=1 Tax=Flavobacterium succinicans TaxID=29536 RepID=A0A1I4ZKX9_9FLAO|nr:DUF456 domain-containing protein [Flavobacterium succinicans]SFN50713.1 hypothetical protein SAMN05444143_1166 [Flavobacterium succinicans]